MSTRAEKPSDELTTERKREVLQEIRELLFLEADLQDQWRLDEWLDLLTDDMQYFVPLARNIEAGSRDSEYTKHHAEMAWFDEDKRVLVQRVQQIQTGVHWAEEPVSRISHLITNIRLLSASEDEGTTSCRFALYRNRMQTETDLFVGKREDSFRRVGDDWRISGRIVHLDQNVLVPKNLTLFF